MQIKIGTYYVNKTWKYLRPCLLQYGSTFTAKYENLFKLATGIHDEVLTGTKYEHEKLIYILIDKKYRPMITQNILEWMSYQSYFVTQYAFDDVIEGRKQMIVLRIPERYHNAYDNFKKSRYSSMYNDDEIDVLFPNQNDTRAVLTRTEEAYTSFIEKVNNNFNSNVTKLDLLGAELDFPLESIKEIFNYKP